MRRLQIAVLAVTAAAIACDLSDSIVGPKTPDKLISKTVGGVPPTNNTACNVHWASGVNGSWFDAAKWNPAGVPGASSSVCIDAAGTYKVILDAPVDSIPTPVLAISIGGVGATATLSISGDKERVNVGEGILIASGGTLLFDSGQGNSLTAVGTITNEGFLKVISPCGGCGAATISADIINSGTLQLTAPLTLSKLNGAYQNTGNMTYGSTITIPANLGNVVFSQESGLFSGAGSFDVFTMRSGVFRLKGGKIRARFNSLPPVVLDGASLVIDSTSTDSVTIGVHARTDTVRTVTGNIPALTTLWLGGATNGGAGSVELLGNPVNYGTIRVSNNLDAYGHVIVAGSGRLTNFGTINNTEANRDTLFYSIDLTNNGTINAIGQSSIAFLKQNGSYNNTSLIDLQAGISWLMIYGGGIFRNSGSITNGLVMVDDSSTFRGTGTLNTRIVAQNGGTVEPGDSIGLITSYQTSITSSGVLNMQIAGTTPVTQYDRLVVQSLADFSGVLNVSEANGFQYGICGQTFDIAFVPSWAAGGFSAINGLNPAPGRMLRPVFVPQTPSSQAFLRLVGYDPNTKVCIGPRQIALTEGGASVQYAIALRDAPAIATTVIVKPVGDSQVIVTDSAVFTTSNWQQPQLITVTAVDDTVYQGTHTGIITHTVKSTDPAYNGYAAASDTATITDNESPPVVTSITVSVDSTSLQVPHTAQATAVVRDQYNNVMNGQTITWTSDTPGFASVSNAGVVTASGAGTAIIRATIGAVFDTASVTITAAPPPPPVVTSIVVSIDSASLQIPHTAQATAVVRDQYDNVMNGQTITWTSDTPGFASVSNAGVVTASGAGTAIIRATIGAVFDTASVTITNAPPPPPVVTSIVVSVDSTSLQIPHTAQATAVVRDQYDNVMNGQTITWTSDTPGFASVSNAGVVTASGAGTAIIRATIGAVFDTASVTITNAPPPPPVVTSIVVSIDSASLQVGNTAQATAVVRDQYNNVMNGQTITWTSDTPGFASVSSLGVVTGSAAGTATIRATIGAVFDTASLAITAIPPAPPEVTTIEVAIDSSSLQVGNTAQATATVKDQYGAVMSGQSVTWSSNTPSFASVTNLGVVTGVAEGTAVIKAAIGGVSGTASVDVTPAPAPITPPPPRTVYSLAITFDSTSLHVGSSTQARAVLRDNFGNDFGAAQIQSWRSLDQGILTVSPSGVVTAKKAGAGRIQATSVCIGESCLLGSGVANPTGTASLPALAYQQPVPKSIGIFVAQLAVGDRSTAYASVYDQYGALMPNQPVQWSVGPSQILTTASGPCVGGSSCVIISPVGSGTGRITATLGNLKDEVQPRVGLAHTSWTGTVAKSQSFTINYFAGCSWNIWVENIRMSADWVATGAGNVTATVRQEAVGGACPQAPWSSTIQFYYSSLSPTGTTVLTPFSANNWYAANFQMESLSKNGMTGYIVFKFTNFGGRAFDIPVKIAVK